MRALPALLLVLVVSAGACTRPNPDTPAGSAVEPETIRIVVYNIHHGEGMDEVTDLERIADLIRTHSPDLVALQEIDSVVTRTGGIDQAKELARLTGMSSYFGRFMPYQGGAYGMAILSAWPIDSAENVRLPDGDEPRSSVVVTVRSPHSGRQLRFADVHFYRTEEERLAQAVALADHLAGSDLPTVIAGDFNSTPGSAVMEFMDQGYEILDKGDDRFTFSSFDPVREIDFVLVGPEDGLEVLDHRPLDEPVASDHRPLFAELRWH